MKRPVAVTVVGWLYIVAGIVGLGFHLYDSRTPKALDRELALVAAICLAAVVCGIFLLRGSNWARWLAVLWMAYHVALSVFHPLPELVIHAVFLAAVVYLLVMRREAKAYFVPAAG